MCPLGPWPHTLDVARRSILKLLRHFMPRWVKAASTVIVLNRCCGNTRVGPNRVDKGVVPIGRSSALQSVVVSQTFRPSDAVGNDGKTPIIVSNWLRVLSAKIRSRCLARLHVADSVAGVRTRLGNEFIARVTSTFRVPL